MTRRVFSEYADTAWTYGGDRPQDMQRSTDDWQAKTRSAPAMALYARRAAEDWQTKVRGVLADEYEIYEEYTTDPTPLTYDEWLNT